LLSIGLTSIISCKKDSSAIDAETTEAEALKPVTNTSKRYTVDTIASTINWVGSKPTGSHSGTINISKGKLFVKNDTLETGKFVLDMQSINVTDPKEGKDKINLENPLKGLGNEDSADHFFNTNKYPTGQFDITAITAENNKTMIEGNLTLKDITKNIKFPAVIYINDTLVTLNSENFKINRTLWNINYNSKSPVKNLGDQYIDDDIELKVNIIAKRKN
jgi:polyisoprenoid-binding protein YceI